MMPPRRDPAESTGLRHFYRNWRPTVLGQVWTRLCAWATALGLVMDPRVVTLLVKDRRCGRLVAHILVPITVEGRMYLVSMLGAGSNWVLDVRGAAGAAFLTRGRRRAVMLRELPATARAPILRAWCQVATSGRMHLPVPPDAPLTAFEAIALDYPVFEVADAA